MDLQQARAELKRPLVFGDQLQLEAINYLEMLRAIRHCMERCRYCRGVGSREHWRTHQRIVCSCIRYEPEQVRRDLKEMFELTFVGGDVEWRRDGTHA